MFTLGLGWIAIIMYAYTVAPPDLVATMMAVVNTIMFVICKFWKLLRLRNPSSEENKFRRMLKYVEKLIIGTFISYI